MTDKDIILDKWLRGEVSDEEVHASIEGIDLDHLKRTLETQEKLEVSTTDPIKQWEIIEGKLPPKPSSQSTHFYVKLLMILAMIIIGIVLVIQLDPSGQTKIETAEKDFMEYAFEDGSNARLWPGSSIIYDEESYSKARTLELRGQAFFDVSKGAPFIVKTKAGSIEVLGTSFDVWSIDDELTEVICYSGQVRVSDNKNNQVILMPGEKVRIEENLIGSKEVFGISRYQQDNQVKYYENAKVSWVIDDLEKLFGRPIDLNKTLDTERFTGVISIQELNLALNYLCTTMRWSCDQENTIIHITSEE